VCQAFDLLEKAERLSFKDIIDDSTEKSHLSH